MKTKYTRHWQCDNCAKEESSEFVPWQWTEYSLNTRGMFTGAVEIHLCGNCTGDLTNEKRTLILCLKKIFKGLTQ